MRRAILLLSAVLLSFAAPLRPAHAKAQKADTWPVIDYRAARRAEKAELREEAERDEKRRLEHRLEGLESPAAEREFRRRF